MVQEAWGEREAQEEVVRTYVCVCAGARGGRSRRARGSRGEEAPRETKECNGWPGQKGERGERDVKHASTLLRPSLGRRGGRGRRQRLPCHLAGRPGLPAESSSWRAQCADGGGR